MNVDFPWRMPFKEVKGAVFAFFDCGIPENGMTLIRCS